MEIKRNTDLEIERGKPLFIQLTSDTARELRLFLWGKANGICPILHTKIAFKSIVLDHKHKRKTDPIGPNGAGLVRGILDFRANSLEGIFLKKFKKSGLLGKISYIVFLRRLADYLEHPECPQYYIYPSERPPGRKLSKRDFDLICRWYKIAFPRRKKALQYPVSGIKIKKVKVPGKVKKVTRRSYRAKLSSKWALMLDKAKEAKKQGLI